MKKKALTLVCLLLSHHYIIAQYSSSSFYFDKTGEYMKIIENENQITLMPFFLTDEKVLLTQIDPGTLPDGDNPTSICFTPDGERILVTNALTNNVSIIDWETKEYLATCNVGNYPIDIQATDSCAIVACLLSDEVYVINLNEYNIDTVLNVDIQPVDVILSPDFNYVYVTCDYYNRCYKINLDTKNIDTIYNSFPIDWYSTASGTRSGRTQIKFTDVIISPDGQYLIGYNYTDGLVFVNTETGIHDFQIPKVKNCRNISYSGNDSIIIATGYAASISSYFVYQVDATTYNFIKEVPISPYSNSYSGIAVNHNGTKAVVGSSGGSLLIRFETGDYTIISQTIHPRWVKSSLNNDFAIIVSNILALIDFQSELITNQINTYSSQIGAISPLDSIFIIGDIFNTEYLNILDYSNPYSIELLGTIDSGESPEGDGPYRISINQKGTKAISVNPISSNISVFDMKSKSLDTIIDIGSTGYGLTVSSTDYALVSCSGLNQLKIFDLVDYSLLGAIDVDLNPFNVNFSYDGSLAFVGNFASNTMSVIHLEGSPIINLGNIPVGDIGALLLFPGYGVQSGICPDSLGQYVLVAATFDNKVKVIEISTLSVIADLEVGNTPLQITYLGDNMSAVVNNYSDNTLSFIHVDGTNSYVSNTVYCGGEGPTRIAYSPITTEIYVANRISNNVSILDAVSWSLKGNINLSSYGSPIQVSVDSTGLPIILTTNSSFLIHNKDTLSLPARPSYFDYSYNFNQVAVCMPGPDYVSIIDLAVIELNLKVFLEGAFDDTNMQTFLNFEFLPFYQPYNCFPWYYKGSESVTGIPNNHIVDWILLELRETTGDAFSATSDSIIMRRAAFILSNGQIVDTDGESLIRTNLEITDNLFVVIRHRNHLPIMSSEPLNEISGKYIYDFTSNQYQALGGASIQKELNFGVWGMISADGNFDGIISIHDKDPIWEDQSGKKGYLPTDYNLDGQGNNYDKNDFWIPNIGRSSIIPY